MEFNFSSNDVFGSRARLYQENGASPAAVENGHLYNGHKGVKDVVNNATVPKQPQPVANPPASPQKPQAFHDSFEQQPLAEETMSFAKMNAAMAAMRARA